jgi:catechol 2,3-dioxygenase-like lactoylglutathione lyase family enzyme
VNDVTTQDVYPVIVSTDPARTAAFYRDLLGLDTTFAAGWYESLAGPGGSPQIAAVHRDHDSIPTGFSTQPAGVLVTVEVEEADAIRARAEAMQAPIVMETRDEDWGQRHFMTRDPDGLLVDVIEIIPASPEFEAKYAGSGRPDSNR